MSKEIAGRPKYETKSNKCVSLYLSVMLQLLVTAVEKAVMWVHDLFYDTVSMSDVATCGEGIGEWWIWNGTVKVQFEVPCRDWEKQRNPSATIAGLWVWAWNLLNTKHDFWLLDCNYCFFYHGLIIFIQGVSRL